MLEFCLTVCGAVAALFVFCFAATLPAYVLAHRYLRRIFSILVLVEFKMVGCPFNDGKKQRFNLCWPVSADFVLHLLFFNTVNLQIIHNKTLKMLNIAI